MRRFCRRLASWLVFAVVALVVSDCTDSSVSPKRGKSAGLSIAPLFSAGATSALQTYQSNGIDLDRVRVTITRLPSEILAEEELLLAGQPKEFTRDVVVQASVGEVLSARVEFRAGTAVLFAGSGPVVARAANDQSPADQVTIQAVGPGATATRVTVAPATGAFPTTAPVAFTARAFDPSNAEIQGAVFDWSVDNIAVGTVSALGVVQPTPTGGLLHVRAKTLNGVTGEAIVTFGNTGPGLVAIATQPSGAVSGVNLTTQPVVQIRDANNNVIPSSTAAVTAAIASGSGTLLGTRTVNAVNGVATFSNLRIDGSGPHTLSFTATGFTAATSSSFPVTQNIASLTIQTQPSGGTSGSPLPGQPVIRILDNAGLVVSGSTLAVSATIASGNGTVVSGSPVNAVNGAATFTSLRVDGTGPQTLTFSTTNPSLSVTSTGFAMNAAPATQIVIRTQPSGAVSGIDLTTQPIVEFRDANNAIVTGTTGSVLAQITSGTGRLLGNTTVNAVNGVATFTNLRINGAGPHTIGFTAIGLPPVTSSSFTVSQTPASLFIRTQPAGSTSGSALTIQPVIEIHDNANILIANSTLTVTATVFSSTNGATIAAGASVNAVGGVATFANLTMTGSGGVTLVFSIPTSAISIQAAPFAVNGSTPP